MRRIWKTREGIKLKIKEMEMSHIRNCVKMLKRIEEIRLRALALEGMALHGEMAIDCFDCMYDSVLEDGFDDINEYLDSFNHELIKRGEWE